MKIAVVDYGLGNLGSVLRALAELGADAAIAERPEQLAAAERIILPGVGSFTDGMAYLNEHGWSDEIRRQTLEIGKPLLGICLGMQLLASVGSEGASGSNTPGLDLISGQVVRLDTLGCTLRIPHVGWNAIVPCGEPALFAGIPAGTDFYFVHSFAFRPARPEDILASTDYGVPVVAAIGNGCVLGTQFHPEKSSKAGLRLLKNFLELAPC
jgi:imidazole glycerol-phosphate synthase subunit HisH